MDGTIILTAAGTIISVIGINVTLFSWIRSDMKSFETKIESKIDSFKDEVNREMKDFHGRLIKQDAEFKGQLALQDAQLKAFLMNKKGPIAWKKEI